MGKLRTSDKCGRVQTLVLNPHASGGARSHEKTVVIPDLIRNPGIRNWIAAFAAMTRCDSVFFVITGLFCLFVGGCGYRLYPASGKIGPEVKKVYVAVFTNNTPEANIETGFRNAFIDQFIKGRRFKVVDSEGAADAVLQGDIRNMILAPLSYRGDSNIAVEKRITVTLSLTLEAKGASSPLWREANFSQWGDFTLDSANLLAGLASQQRALAKLADDVAEKAYRRMIADF